MLKPILNKSISLSLENYEGIINNVVKEKSIADYDADMHTFIDKNFIVEKYVEANLNVSKKFFNIIQRSHLSQLNLLTEAWCLDACIVLPLLKSIQIIRPEIEIKIYRRDLNEELMNLFLTNGSKSIPIIFGLDNNENKIFHWGPRSLKAKDILMPILKESYGIKYQTLSEFYKTDLTQSIQDEWISLL